VPGKRTPGMAAAWRISMRCVFQSRHTIGIPTCAELRTFAARALAWLVRKCTVPLRRFSKKLRDRKRRILGGFCFAFLYDQVCAIVCVVGLRTKHWGDRGQRQGHFKTSWPAHWLWRPTAATVESELWKTECVWCKRKPGERFSAFFFVQLHSGHSKI